MHGVLVLNIPMAKGLVGRDNSGKSSDPYVVIKFPDAHGRSATIKTKVIDKTLNPIWNFEHRYRVNILREDYLPIEFVVEDHNDLAPDEPMGTVKIEWLELFKNPSNFL
jgi:Ca2+-dependent lipid-binding protein